MADNKTKKNYYPHYYGERNTPQMIRLFMALNMEGVGIYTYLKEKVAENDGKMSLDDVPAIAFEFRIDTPDGIKKLERVIKEFGLFEIDEETHTFYSPAIQENLKYRAEISEKRSQAGKASHKKPEDETENTNDLSEDEIYEIAKKHGMEAGRIDPETGEILKPPVNSKKLSTQIQAFMKKFPEVNFDCGVTTLKTLNMEKLEKYTETLKYCGKLTQGYSLIKLLDDFNRNNKPYTDYDDKPF